MKESPGAAMSHRRKEQQRKLRAKQPTAKKLAIATNLRDAQQALASTRKANKAKRAAGKVEIRIKTA